MTVDNFKLVFVHTIKNIVEQPGMRHEKKAEIINQLRDTMLQKYKDEIDIKIKRITEIPSFIVFSDRFHEQLFECLGTYQEGYFRSTIALAGMIAEIITSGLIEESDIHVNGKVLTGDQKKILIGLNQSEKIGVLKDFKIISSEAAEDLHKIRKLRNKYVHSSDSLEPEGDAREAMRLLVNIVDRLYALGVRLVEGNGQKIQIQYLKREKVD